VQCGANESYRKELKYPRNWLRRLQNFAPVEMCSRQEATWFHQVITRVFRGKNSEKKWLIRWSLEKISSGQSSQLSLEASAYRIQTDVNCQIAVSNYITTSPCFPWRSCSCFTSGRYCRLSFYIFDRSFEISLIYLIWYHMREIWKITNNKMSIISKPVDIITQTVNNKYLAFNTFSLLGCSLKWTTLVNHS